MNITIPYKLLGDFEDCDSVVFLISRNNKWLYKYELSKKTNKDFFEKKLEYITIPIEYMVAAEKEAIYFYTLKDGKWSEPIEFQPETVQLRKKNSSFELITRGEALNKDADYLLNYIKEGVDIINNAELIPSGGKNLLYFVVNYDKNYIYLFELALKSIVQTTPNINFDLLIITPSTYLECFEKIEELKKFKYDFMFVPHAETGIKASMNKISIYSYDKINDYRKILYLDSDILVRGDLSEIFNINITDGKLYSSIHTVREKDHMLNNVFHNIIDYPPEKLDELKSKNIHGFNAGQFLFLNSNKMKAHFLNLNTLVDRWKWTYFFEQSFMNYYFNTYELSDVFLLLNKFTFQTLEVEYDLQQLIQRKCTTIHFVGQATKFHTKLAVMKELFYNTSCQT